MKCWSLCVLALYFCVSAFAGDETTVHLTCEEAISKAEIRAAHRKWWPDRPDPKAFVLNIRTHANFVKDMLPLGGIISHEKVGELIFEQQGDSCLIVSNGHPADVVLADLAGTKTQSDKNSAASECRDNPMSMLDCHGRVKNQTQSQTAAAK
jgi:hypothetical protein